VSHTSRLSASHRSLRRVSGVLGTLFVALLMAEPASAQTTPKAGATTAPAPKPATPTAAAPAGAPTASPTAATAPTTTTTATTPTDPSATPPEAAPTATDAPPVEGEAVAPQEEATPVEEAPATTPAEATPSEEEEVRDDDAGWLDLHPDEEKEEPTRKMPYYTAMVLAEGTAKYGGYTVAEEGATLEDESVETESLRTGQLGGQVTVGVMPSGSAFAMAGRLRGGSYVGERVPGGYVAAEMLFGANFARNAQGSSFTYLLGGIGVEFLPGDNQDLLSLSATGGTVVNGIDFGAGINIAANDEVAIALIGMHIGWGRLF
jgi:hypothetical protein